MTREETNEINSNIVSLILSQKEHVTRGEFSEFKQDMREFKHDVYQRFERLESKIDTKFNLLYILLSLLIALIGVMPVLKKFLGL